MKRVVNGSFFRLASPDFDGLPHRRSIERYKIQNRRRSAEGRGFVPCVVIVGRDRPKHRQVKVGVGIDSAGKDQLAARINSVVGSALQIGSDLADLFAIDQNIGNEGLGGRDQPPVSYQDAHQGPPTIPKTRPWQPAAWRNSPGSAAIRCARNPQMYSCLAQS